MSQKNPGTSSGNRDRRGNDRDCSVQKGLNLLNLGNKLQGVS